jgi:hypothetical protein
MNMTMVEKITSNKEEKVWQRQKIQREQIKYQDKDYISVHRHSPLDHLPPANFTNGMAPVIFWMPLLPTIRSIRSTVPGLNAIRCCALTRITSSEAG